MEYFVVICAVDVSTYVFEPIIDGKAAVTLLTERLQKMPPFVKTLVYTYGRYQENIRDAFLSSGLPAMAVHELENNTNAVLFSAINRDKPASADAFLFVYADAPFLDTVLTEQLYEQHRRYQAEYSFADGYPQGLAPEILASGIAAILAEKTAGSPAIISRNTVFEIIEKDINSYDIETLIAPYDARYLRLSFFANTKRNYVLCLRYPHITAKNFPQYVENNAQGLRLLPAFYNIETTVYSPLNSIYRPPIPKGERNTVIKIDDFTNLVKKIAEFSDDAVVNFSVFGDPVLHPELERLIEIVLAYPKLSVMIETAGLGWSAERLQHIKDITEKTSARPSDYVPIYWIVAIDALSSNVYGTIHNVTGNNAAQALKEAGTFADRVYTMFNSALWVQTTRMNENEEELEPFYRFWKDRVKQVIIQKYDAVCGILPDRRVADLAPLNRVPCWHLKRDMTVLSDGTVPLCRDDLTASVCLGNAFTESLEIIWERGCPHYTKHLTSDYKGICSNCDEYYTYNF